MHSITSLLKTCTLVSSFICFGMVAYASQPVILFSDIESGPKSGWSETEPNKGAAVSIWGIGLGDKRGASFVTVNGVELSSSTDYAIWGEYWPTEYFQRITFWLNDQMMDGLGELTVTVNGVESNPLPFTIREGSIYFITNQIWMETVV